MNQNLKRLKEIELNMLISFDEICQKHNLNYFLAGGTFLGAIRHKGFIPWDDDIDIGMPRKDYEKFCEYAKKELPNNLVLQNFETEPNCGLVFAKIRKKGTTLSEVYSHHIDMSQGVWIDIFPFDNVPDDEQERNKMKNKVLFYKNLYIIKCGYKNPKPDSTLYKIMYFICKIIVKFISKDWLICKLKSLMTKYNDTQTKYVYPYGGAYPKKDMLEYDLVSHLEKREFEHHEFLTCSDYDKYLKQLYGDYMQLPPEDKRTSGMHNIYEINIEGE
ncbi:LicD family protein [Floccifex sp.]|uniref:LicD family protein n=1 Tax=Floccifex sp. TaxID=2815810 RepID=UPI0029FF35F7|nr:LicD family protein [Floccifex sp.]MDD7281952.1 LicD family protein [Erysipelotrichaceae bacterium]MDY2957847.1 LicD family protein [Floccifex sp.]